MIDRNRVEDSFASDSLRFIYLDAFERKVRRERLEDAFLRSLELAILSDPTRAPVLKETGGLRKIRLAREGEGKRGGYRICYAYYETFRIVVVVTMFAKNEKDNLTQSERRQIADLLDAFGRQLREGIVT